MEFRRKDHEETSAFSRPLLPPSSSLLPHRPKPTEAGNGIISASSGDGGIGDGNQNTADSSSPAAAAAAAAATIRYRECLRNHAASLGGHVLDGCCEFMPGGASGDEALKCAACGCHRSFHRKESPDGGNLTLNNSNSSSFYHGRVVPNGSPNNVPLLLPPPHPHHHSITPQILPHRHPQKHQHQNQMIPPGFAGFASNSGGGTTTESSSEERQLGPAGAAPPHHRQFGSGGAPRKRFRTKFTPEQKDKLLGFAERVGWRIQKQDDAAVEAFCGEAGVSRQVLKVWMHNNKHTLRKQQQPTPQLYQQQQQQHHQEVVHQEAEEDVCED